MSLDPLYITSVDLSPYLVNKSTGEALAYGKIYFFKDDDRTDPKPVFELSYNSMTGIYSYSQLPNPVTLSATGTIDDGNGNNVALYYYPYDEFGNVELYYVVVVDAGNQLQFTRDAWPYPNVDGGSSGGGNSVNSTNMLTNPQFAKVLFNAGQTLTISYTGAGTDVIELAPGWDLNITYTGNGSIDVVQTPIAGSSAFPFNPPYTLNFTPGSNITRLTLTQRLNNNPDWAAPQVANSGGYLSGSILLGPSTSVTMNYVKSAGSPASQEILSETNSGGTYTQVNGTIQLDPASNPQTGAVGYDIIEIVLPFGAPSIISNVQVVPLTSNATITSFDQTPVNRQIDQMFNYYKPQLDYKPIKSYLIGWDFPLNPMQLLGPTVAASAIGANKSKYVWDQTIVFQSTNSGVGVTRANSGALVTTAAATTQMALIQYLPATIARKILNGPSSANVSALTSVVAGVTATISLWYTTGASLPSMSTNDSIVASLDANGKPATFNLAGGVAWTEVTRSKLGDAKFTIGTSSTENFNNYGFSGWDIDGIAAASTATFFAIVVGTASVTSPGTISWNSISLVPGYIPTIPAPQTLSEVLHDCQAFVEKSFDVGTVPIQALGTSTGETMWMQGRDGSSGEYMPSVKYSVAKYQTPSSITTYNPSAANAQVRNEAQPIDCSNTAVYNSTLNGFSISYTTPGGTVLGQLLGVHWVTNAQLGY